MIRLKSAVKISAEWHGGQWSALCQFASSGKYLVENHLRYLQEIESDLHPEYNLHPSILSKLDERNLTGLKSFFIDMGKMAGIETIYQKHWLYGYSIPFLGESTATDLKYHISGLTYAV